MEIATATSSEIFSVSLELVAFKMGVTAWPNFPAITAAVIIA